jgi:hypothetical protein
MLINHYREGLMEITKEIAGVGAYFEFLSSTNSSYELLLLPEGYTETKKKVSPTAFFRVRWVEDSRSRWRSNNIHLSTVDFSDPETLPLFFLSRLVRANYTTLRGPFLFEMSSADFTALEKTYSIKIPPRIASKVKKVRESEEFISSAKELPGGV